MFRFKIFDVTVLSGAVIWIRWNYTETYTCNKKPYEWDPVYDSWWGIVDFGSVLLMFYCIFTFNNWVCYLCEIYSRHQHARRQRRANERQHRQAQQ